MLRRTRVGRLAALLALLLCCALLPIHGFALAEVNSAPVGKVPAEPEAEPAQPEAESAEPEATQSPIEEIEATELPSLEATVEPPPSVSPQATLENSTGAEASPAPEATAEPTAEPAPEASPEATAVPENSATPESTMLPENSATPESTLMPQASDVPDPTPDTIGCIMLEKSKAEGNRRLNPAALDIPSDGMPIPRIYQGEYKTAICTVDGESKSVATSGCGATAASMLIAYISENYNQTPYSLFYWAATHGHYSGYGLSYEAVQHMLVRYGVDGRLMGVSSDNIVNHLKKNRPIIIKMGPGAFTDEGHYIVLRGLDEQGNVLVNDPNNAWISTQSYPASMIAREAKEDHMLVAYTSPVSEATPAPTAIAVSTPKPEPNGMAAAVDATMAPVLDVPKANAVVSGSCVNLRVHPVDGEVAAQAFQGEQLSVLSRTDIQADGHVWCQIYYQGQKLYMRSDMLKSLS